MRILIAFFILSSSLAAQETFEVVLWNAKTLFDVAGVNSRGADLAAFGSHFSDADIIILDEVCSIDVVNAAREKMGFASFHTACSDFNQNDFDTFSSLEVGIISRLPIEQVTEFDVTPDNSGSTGEPAEETLQRVDLDGIADDVSPGRGFLTCHVPSLGLTLVATHLKSSGGGEEDRNAKKREFVAAAMAKYIAGKLNSNASATILAAGDFNVGETDVSKNGHRLSEDHMNAAAGDLYDDTHAIFSDGLVDNLYMASLTKAIGAETYDDDRFAGSGPIDCMYIAGKQSGRFTLATKSASTFGSDHFAVSVKFHFSGTVPPPSPVPSPPAGPIGGTSVSIVRLLANPAGEDPGHEWVELQNTGSDSVSLDGWVLRDEANHSKMLSGVVAAGEVLRILLAAGEVPLNNGGDEIQLRDATGATVSLRSYVAGQAVSGQILSF